MLNSVIQPVAIYLMPGTVHEDDLILCATVCNLGVKQMHTYGYLQKKPVVQNYGVVLHQAL